MAKVKSDSRKTNFGKRKRGKYKKRSGPKDKPIKPYNKQGK